MRTAVASRVSARRSSFLSRDVARDRTIGSGSSIAAGQYRGGPRRGAQSDAELGRSGARATVHQPSIRARTPAHDVAFDPRRSGSSRVGAQTVSRSRATIDHSRTPALERLRGLRVLASDELELRGTGVEVLARWDAAAPAELGIVNLITHHDQEADEQLAGHGHPGLGAAAAMDQGAIETVKVAVRAGGEGGGWPRTQRSSALPCLVIGPRWHVSAEALRRVPSPRSSRRACSPGSGRGVPGRGR